MTIEWLIDGDPERPDDGPVPAPTDAPSPVTIDLRDPEYRKNPYPTLAKLREHDPVHCDANGIWFITSYADVNALNRDTRLGRDLRKWVGYPLLRPYLADSTLEQIVEKWIFSLDPPDHTRLRKLVLKTFTPRAVAAMREHIESIADELLDEIQKQAEPTVDLVSAFAMPFPVRVIAAVLGLPVDNYAELRSWSDAISKVVEPTSRRRERTAADAAAIQMRDYLRTRIAERRMSPRDDLLSELIRVEEEGDHLTEDEMISQLVLLFVAGHETTANLIGNGMLALCRNPSQMALLRSDPLLIPRAVEEMLRYEGPANTNGRVAHEDIHLRGKTIGAGQAALCMLGAANRDPEVFRDPDVFDVTRDPNPHVTFGGGVHYCLGAPLARLEAQIAFERLLARFEGIVHDEDSVRYRDLVNIRGLESLPLKLRRARG